MTCLKAFILPEHMDIDTKSIFIEDLDADKAFAQLQALVEVAADCFKKLDDYKAPRDKLRCILNGMDLLNIQIFSVVLI